MNKEKFYLLLSIAVFIAIGLTSSQVIFATWEPPSTEPPHDNVDAPINTSSDIQYKDGPLHVSTVDQGTRYGLTVENGFILAEDGLQIEQRTNDPSGNPADINESDPLSTGRIWLRTDL